MYSWPKPYLQKNLKGSVCNPRTSLRVIWNREEAEFHSEYNELQLIQKQTLWSDHQMEMHPWPETPDRITIYRQSRNSPSMLFTAPVR